MKKLIVAVTSIILILILTACNSFAFVEMREEKTDSSWAVSWKKFKGEKSVNLVYNRDVGLPIVEVHFEGDYENVTVTIEQNDNVIEVDMSHFKDKNVKNVTLKGFVEGEFTVRIKSERCLKSSLVVRLNELNL